MDAASVRASVDLPDPPNPEIPTTTCSPDSASTAATICGMLAIRSLSQGLGFIMGVSITTAILAPSADQGRRCSPSYFVVSEHHGR